VEPRHRFNLSGFETTLTSFHLPVVLGDVTQNIIFTAVAVTAMSPDRQFETGDRGLGKIGWEHDTTQSG